MKNNFINLVSKSKRDNLDYLKKLAEHKKKNSVKDSGNIDANDTLSIKTALAILLNTLKGIKKSIDEYNDTREFNKEYLKAQENKEKQELQSGIKDELKTNQLHKKELDKLESKMKNKTSNINFTKNHQRLRYKQ